MKKKLFLLFFAITLNSLSQSFNLKGNVKNTLGNNIKNVNITNSSSKINYVTNKNGNFKIPVKNGDIIIFSHISYYKTTYAVNYSKKINIILRDNDTQLSELVIKTKKRKKKKIYKIGFARVDVRSPNYFYGDRILPNFFSVGQFLEGRVAGLSIVASEDPNMDYVYLRDKRNPVLWDVDGLITKIPPIINTNEIMSIAVLKSVSQTSVYGILGAGGVIVVRTFPDAYQKDLRDAKSLNNPITNDNFYGDDAVPYKNVKKNFKYTNNYLDNNYETIADKYEENRIKYGKNEDFFEQNIIFFKEHYFPEKIIYKAVKEYDSISKQNIEKLDFIAFNYSLLNDPKKAITTYKKIALAKSNSPKSFRNLAMAYFQNKDYSSAWKVYKYFLLKGNKIDDSNLGKIINAEMLLTYQKLKENNLISENFEFNEFSSIKESDVRIVFEWDKGDKIEFELVNPKKQNYVYTPDFMETSSFKDFYITDINQIKSEWMLNVITSNTENKPTLLKSTVYYNWGKSNQSQKSIIFYLDNKNFKYNLFLF